MRRRLTRRVTSRGAASSYYKEEEEGYGEGEYWDEEFEDGFDMAKIRVKVALFLLCATGTGTDYMTAALPRET
jgi:hypothetical protein